MSDAARALTGVSFSYRLCDWRVESDLALPELQPWNGPDRAPDLVIKVAPVAPALADPILSTATLVLDGHRRGRFEVEGIASFLIEDGRQITIDPQMDVNAPDVRLFLLGTPLGLIYLHRGMVPLHAAAVEIDGEAVLMAGSSRVGKSTLAAAFVRNGYRMVSDDVAPLEFTDTGIQVYPSLRRIRLWADALEGLGIHGELERCRGGIEKFSQPVLEGTATEPLRPTALIHLRRQADSVGEMMFRRIRGRAATNELGLQVYRRRAMGAILGDASTLTLLSRAAATIPQHYMLSRPLRFADLDRTVEAIVETVRAAR
ncbi:MAG: hypothetical protein ACAH11_04360 [Sphingomonas sp.]